MNDSQETLSRLVDAAIDELAALRSPDPCAAMAMTVVDLLLHNLRELWVPHLNGDVG